MAVRYYNILFLISFLCFCLSLAPPARATHLVNAFAPLTEAITTAACIDPWRTTRPCRSPASLLSSGIHPAELANRWWSDLWSTAGEVAASPHLALGGRRVSCGAGYEHASLFKLDFANFQLDMDVDLDTEEDRFDSVRLAYRSCWR
jgi:hypothetical protein